MGQIQTAQIELEALCARLAPVFMEYLRTHGTAVDRIETATTLDGITSLPARYSLGGVEKNVLAPLGLLRAGVDDAIGSCTSATADARAAAAGANAAAAKADKAAEDCDEARQEAEDAALRADEAAGRVDDAIKSANDTVSELLANEAERQLNEQERERAEQERDNREAQRMSAERERAAAEGERAAAETLRVSAEARRVKSESGRVEAEQLRESKFNESVKSAEAAAMEAINAAGECRTVTEQIQGIAGYIPTSLECDAPQCITLGNTHEFAIAVRLLPEKAAQNILFLGDDGAVSVAPDGKITVNRAGESVIHIVPVARVALFKTVRIRVAEPAMALTAAGSVRLSGSGGIILR